ncbi:MAG: hypothetical protein Q4F75_07135 [Pseudomonadota bacterium]|nr:hypothetical protein [Pseudomonadota bacterium]
MKTEKDSPCLCRDDDNVFTGFYQHGIFSRFWRSIRREKKYAFRVVYSDGLISPYKEGMSGRTPIGIAFCCYIIALADSESEVNRNCVKGYCNQHSFCGRNDILADRDIWKCINAHFGSINTAMREIGGQPLKKKCYWIDILSEIYRYRYYYNLHEGFSSIFESEAFIRPILTNF